MNEVIKLPEYSELIKVAVNWEYGTIHSHEEIASIMKLQACSKKYYSHMTVAIKKLTEEGKRLVAVKGKGYQVLHPDEYTKESVKKVSQAKRKIVESERIAAFAPVEKMTDEGRIKYDNYCNRLATFKALVEGSTVELKQLAALKPKIQLNK